MVLACDEKRGALRRKEGNGNGSTGEEEETKTRRDCRGRKCISPLTDRTEFRA